MLKIPYGISNFERIRKNNFLYVDKTRFIKMVEAMDYVLHLRPRRFGKSLFVDMLDNYYDVASADRFDELFSGLSIHENPTEYQNKYYILRLDFSGIQNTASENLEQGFLRRVKIDVEIFIDRYNLDIKLGDSSSSAGVLDFLLKGFKALKLEHKIYVLIDEYDHFTNSLLTGDGVEFLSVLQRGGFVRSFYEIIKRNAGSGLVERIFMTGVMSVTLDSMTSGFNIASNITTRKSFSDMMGFTADEVQDLLKLTYSNPEEPEEIVQLTNEEQVQIYNIFKENYNGYLFSEDSSIRVFNSTLIIYYLQNYLPYKLPPKSLVDANLNQSGATIESIVGLKNHEQNYKIIEVIINEKQIGGKLQPFFEIDKRFDKNDLITLLFNIGFLTIKESGFSIKFEIPNRIIENIYVQYLSEMVQRRHNYIIDISEQEHAVEQVGEHGKIDALTELVSDFLMHTSNRNTLNFDEKYIKLFYKFLLSSTEQFSVYDEFPSLQGYGDLIIFKAPNSYAKYELLIELKYIKKGDTTDTKIEEVVADGIRQIKKYMGDERLAKRIGIKKFVIVFSGFEPVRLLEL